jgi:hypothetical protein
MENFIDKYSCGRADQIVAYIYNEIEPDDRLKFEQHLAGCMSCTDEFAAVADARYSVFEWHKVEFADLPTPRFAIPSVPETRAIPGFVLTLIGIVRNAGWAVPAAAVVMISIAFAVYFLSIRENKPEVAQTVPDRTEFSLAAGSKEVTGRAGGVDVRSVEPVDDVDSERVKAPPLALKVTHRAAFRRKAANTLKQPSTRIVQPVLSRFADIEDRSLRLADLLDEVGG